MSIFDPIPQSELGTKYTHYGWFAGLVQIYMGNVDSEAPDVAERNWVPVWYFWAVEQMFGLFCDACALFNPAFVPVFPMLITGKIRP